MFHDFTCKYLWFINLVSIKITTHLLCFYSERSLCVVNFLEISFWIASVSRWNSFSWPVRTVSGRARLRREHKSFFVDLRYWAILGSIHPKGDPATHTSVFRHAWPYVILLIWFLPRPVSSPSAAWHAWLSTLDIYTRDKPNDVKRWGNQCRWIKFFK